ncbi:MAG: hypothetical protein AB1546_00205 [bacterium]
MRVFKIVFYRSEKGELTKFKEFYREAEALSDLLENPPFEFYDAMKKLFPLHGWAEVDDEQSTVFVIFTGRKGRTGRARRDAEKVEFRNWLKKAKPSDFGF